MVQDEAGLAWSEHLGEASSKWLLGPSSYQSPTFSFLTSFPTTSPYLLSFFTDHSAPLNCPPRKETKLAELDIALEFSFRACRACTVCMFRHHKPLWAIRKRCPPALQWINLSRDLPISCGPARLEIILQDADFEDHSDHTWARNLEHCSCNGIQTVKAIARELHSHFNDTIAQNRDYRLDKCPQGCPNNLHTRRVVDDDRPFCSNSDLSPSLAVSCVLTYKQGYSAVSILLI